jgi:hypothetical protein
MAEENRSIGWVIRMLALAIAYACGGSMPADYFQNNPGEGPARRRLLCQFRHSVAELPGGA